MRWQDLYCRPFYLRKIQCNSFQLFYIQAPGVTVEYRIGDRPMQEVHPCAINQFYQYADAIILAYDITRKETFGSLGDWPQDLRSKVQGNIKMVIAGNKIDLVEYEVVPMSVAKKLMSS
eukprot:TRINITY_DN109117_c0_g1_i1.p3 TRINITY_DN109117_c0_g1~~TRINITY_DN109117_c0_g1_i1.p3  ORF type:complete len:119 (+),score=0.87 TRINITY_DN109117_c0_g1_i1:194-550(+)